MAVVTSPEDMPNVTDFEPPGTVTEDGVFSRLLPSAMNASTPAAGADCGSVRVQVLVAREGRVCGVHERLYVAGAITVIETVRERPPKDAVMVAVWSEVTAPAAAEKLPEVIPAARVMEVGTLTALLLLESGTALPDAGAALVRTTVQVLDAPGPRLEGVQFRDERAGAATRERGAVREMPAKEAVTAAV